MQHNVPTLQQWLRQHDGQVAGLDEAGRGCLAGPVVAAAVVLPLGHDIAGLNDSKKLSPQQRLCLYHAIRSHAGCIGVACVSAQRVDQINVLQASLQAMKHAFVRAQQQSSMQLVGAMTDGPYQAPLPAGVTQHALVKADAQYSCVMAASVVAKVMRDRLMQLLDGYYAGYGFAQHKGYPTAMHRQALKCLGLSPIHRRSFAGVVQPL
ncbi:MAG: ribonuclease HII [Myxococcota bacterium]